MKKPNLEGALLPLAAEAFDHLAVDAEAQHSRGYLVVVRDGDRLHCQQTTGRPCNTRTRRENTVEDKQYCSFWYRDVINGIPYVISRQFC